MSCSSKCLEERESHEREFTVGKSTDTNEPIYDTIRCNRVSTRIRMSEREHVISDVLPGPFGISSIISAGII